MSYLAHNHICWIESVQWPCLISCNLKNPNACGMQSYIDEITFHVNPIVVIINCSTNFVKGWSPQEPP